MSRFKIEDFPEGVQRQIRRQLGQYDKPITPGTSGQVPPYQPVKLKSPTGPNKTELSYQAIYLRGMDARYEALTFRMANGHRYTPDWVVFEDGRPIACHECKGSYALQSHQRARLAYDQARTEFPGLRWTWATKKADGWEIANA